MEPSLPPTSPLFMVGLKSVSIYYFASLAILSGAQTGLYSFYMMLTVLRLQGDSAVVSLL